ncbi:MAG: phage/plasmid primase, P4 family [Aliishimia sp.]
MSDYPKPNIKAVQDTLNQAEDVAPIEGLSPPATEPPPRTPDDPPPVDDPHDPFFDASKQPLNDFGNGQRFVIHFGEDIMFVPRVGWFDWEGRVWRKDADELAVRSKAQKLAELIGKEIDYLTLPSWEMELLGERDDLGQDWARLSAMPASERTSDQKQELARVKARMDMADSLAEKLKKYHDRRRTHARNAGNSGPLKNLLHESTTDLAVPFEDLDCNPLDINTESGLMRFKVTDMRDEGGGKVADFDLIEHTRDQKLTKMMRVSYDRNAKAPQFDKFLEHVQPDREMREFLKRWLGLSMTGLKVQKLSFWYGSGANGKGVLIDTISKILDGYAASIKIESLTGTNRRSGAEATPDLIPMLGARLARAAEPEQGERFQEGLIKALTGGEPVPIRPNYGDQIDMDPIFKLTISGNHKPEVRGTDNGIWRRFLLVPWDVIIPDDKADDKLPDKLWAERDGIFAWLVEGLIDYLEGGLQVPENVLSATKEYREESDPIGSFLTTCCAITGSHTDKILSKEFGEAFNYYLMERGDTTWKPTTFAKQVAVKARHWKHPQTGLQFTKAKASLSQYTGLRFTDAFKDRWERAPKDSSGKALGVSADQSPDPALEDFGD